MFARFDGVDLSDGRVCVRLIEREGSFIVWVRRRGLNLIDAAGLSYG